MIKYAQIITVVYRKDVEKEGFGGRHAENDVQVEVKVSKGEKTSC